MRAGGHHDFCISPICNGGFVLGVILVYPLLCLKKDFKNCGCKRVGSGSTHRDGEVGRVEFIFWGGGES